MPASKRRYLCQRLSLSLSLLLLGCTPEREAIDRDFDNETSLRIVSTIRSNTEILIALGMADSLVAVDRFSRDYRELPAQTLYIDFFNVNPERFIKLNPNLIVASETTTTAGSLSLEMVSRAGYRVVTIPIITNFDEIISSIETIASAVGQKERGAALIAGFREELRDIEQVIRDIEERRRVYFEISPSPDIYSVGSGTFQNQIIEAAGGINIFSDQKGWFSPGEEAILKRDPDVIITNVGYIERPVERILARESWQTLSAVQNRQVFLIDKDRSSLPTHKVTETVREVAQKLYPEINFPTR